MNVPLFRFSLRGNMRTYPRSGFWCRGTSAKTTFLETTLACECPTLSWFLIKGSSVPLTGPPNSAYGAVSSTYGGMFSPYGPLLLVFNCRSRAWNLHQGRQRNPNPNFLLWIFSGGVGLFHVKGWGPKSSVCPSKPRETKLFAGISRDFAGISRQKTRKV